MREQQPRIKLALRVGSAAVTRLSDQAEHEGITLGEHLVQIVQEAADRINQTPNDIPFRHDDIEPHP